MQEILTVSIRLKEDIILQNSENAALILTNSEWRNVFTTWVILIMLRSNWYIVDTDSEMIHKGPNCIKIKYPTCLICLKMKCYILCIVLYHFPRYVLSYIHGSDTENIYDVIHYKWLKSEID